MCFVSRALAVDPLEMISQYMRERWGSERGFPGGSVSAIAQTADGYLWIGTDKGLIRFDGLNFKFFQQANPGAFPIGPVQALLGDTEGNLWVLLQNAKILRYHGGKFELAGGEAEFGVTAISRRPDGAALLASLVLGPLTFTKGEFASISSPDGKLPRWEGTAPGKTTNSNQIGILASPCRACSHAVAGTNSAVISIAESGDGKLWLGTRDKGLFYMAEGRLSSVGEGLQNTEITSLLPLDNGELWIGTPIGVIRWNARALTLAGVPTPLQHSQILAMIRDRDSNIWVASAAGLFRVNGSGVSLDGGSLGAAGPVTALFEDREGDLWIGSPRGLERLRDREFVTYSLAGQESESSGPVYVDQEGRTWLAPFGGGLHWLKDGKIGKVPNDQLSEDVTYSITGSKNELWIGGRRGGLTHLSYVRGSISTKTYTQTDGLAQNGVYAVYQSHDGSVWSATLSGGVSQFRDGHFTTYSTANGMLSDTVYSMAETPDGTMWFASPTGLNALSNGQWRAFTVRDGLPTESVNCLLADSAGALWIGTVSGLAFFRSDHVQALGNPPPSLREEIMGIAEDKNGRLWIATSNHVLAAKRESLLSNVFGSSDLREFGLEDGLRGTEGVKRHVSVFADRFGRIWFSMNRGLSVVNATRALSNSDPAIVQIEGISADGNSSDLQQIVRIPAGNHKVIFTYSGLSLSVPERVRFKYKLDGFDQNWSEPVSTREAVYTNLGSGSYRFRVVASNSGGLWNSAESSLAFVIAPFFWQTWWFRTSCVLLILLSVWSAYRYRMYQLTTRFNLRLEERVSERTRIARELHDTLLQSFQGVLLFFQVATDQLPDRPDTAKAKQGLERAINEAAQAISEGRNAIQGLRSSTTEVDNDLAAALSTLGKGLAANGNNQNSPAFEVQVEGERHELHAILRDEVYRIAGEALRNAFLHAQARRIEVDIRYGSELFRVRIRDDGKGMDSRVLADKGLKGHWGLRGMHERAKLVGGNLEVWSKADSGTEVELRIPAYSAYVSSRARRGAWSSWKGTAMKS